MQIERRICCCGSSSWTKIIGWYEIIASAGGMILIFLGMVRVSDVYSKVGIFGLKIELLKQILVHTLMLCILSLAMGIVLLLGSTKSNISQLRAWRIYTATWLFIFSAFCISICFGASTKQIISNIIWLFVNLILYGFFLWVVGVHQKDIEASRQTPPEDVSESGDNPALKV